MGGFYQNPPFDRGMTLYNGATINTSDLAGVEYEGAMWFFPDIDYNAGSGTGVKPLRSNRLVKCMAIRNGATWALKPKYLVRFEKDSHYARYVDGFSLAANERAYPVDEFLPSAGCPANDMCWIVIEGPAMVKTPDGGPTTNIGIGDPVGAATLNTTSGAATAGRIDRLEPLTASSSITDYAPVVEAALHYVGHALSARTTGETAADLLVDVGHW